MSETEYELTPTEKLWVELCLYLKIDWDDCMTMAMTLETDQQKQKMMAWMLDHPDATRQEILRQHVKYLKFI